MQIIVLSDTHMPRMAKQFPEAIVKDLEVADLIIHAGDWQTIEIWKQLTIFGKVIGVTGNTDSPELKTALKDRELVSINGYNIGITHGHGKGSSTEKRALKAFADEPVDCIIFGHSHIPMKKLINGKILFNPGSATDKRRQPKFSYGKISLDSSPVFEHIFYENKQ